MVHPFGFGALAMSPTPSRRASADEARRIRAAGSSTLQVSDHVVRTPLAPLIAPAGGDADREPPGDCRTLRAAFGSDGSSVSVEGSQRIACDLRAVPAPVRPGGPPLLHGGGSPRRLRFAAATADIAGVDFGDHRGAHGLYGPDAASTATLVDATAGT
ncbi:hypothetical protein ACXR2U_16080 [Jatrophihabitans sp. YIM 134969]